MDNENTTKHEILEAINDFSTNVDKQFSEIRSEITGIKSEITGIKSTMVTKDYLDDKMADLRGDLTVMMRKEDRKMRELVEVLREKNVLTDQDRHRILSLEPFPII